MIFMSPLFMNSLIPTTHSHLYGNEAFNPDFSDSLVTKRHRSGGNSMKHVDILLNQLQKHPLQVPPKRPRLFMEPEDRTKILASARHIEGFIEHSHRKADEAIQQAQDPGLLKQPLSYLAGKLLPISQYYYLTLDEHYAIEAIKIIEQLCNINTWIAPVHAEGTVYLDHVAANVGALFGIALDYLGDAVTPGTMKKISQAMLEKCIEPFRRSMKERADFWTKRACVSNWRIMTCGEAGLATLAIAEFVPDVNEVLQYALEGVVDMFDRLPDDGGFVEGPNYFIGTYGFGMRFGEALSRMTNGEVNILKHPALTRIPNYILHVTRPDGTPWNYGDNKDDWSAARSYFLLLAGVTEREDLAQLGRAATVKTLEQIIWDPNDLAESPPMLPTATRFYPAGIITMRSDWSDEATFVGIRCGPNDQGHHTHLDAGSFVLQRGSIVFVPDPGVWPYDHPHGFFDRSGPRWDYDANATISHSTLLIDGKGQLFLEGQQFDPVLAFTRNERLDCALIDLTKFYGDRALECKRWFAFVKPDILVVYDRIRFSKPLATAWVLSHNGNIEGDFKKSILKCNSETLIIKNLDVEEQEGWRVVDEKRTTNYWSANEVKRCSRSITIRHFSRIHPTSSQRMVFLLHIGKPDAVKARLMQAPELCIEIQNEKGIQTLYFNSDERKVILK